MTDCPATRSPSRDAICARSTRIGGGAYCRSCVIPRTARQTELVVRHLLLVLGGVKRLNEAVLPGVVVQRANAAACAALSGAIAPFTGPQRRGGLGTWRRRREILRPRKSALSVAGGTLAAGILRGAQQLTRGAVWAAQGKPRIVVGPARHSSHAVPAWSPAGAQPLLKLMVPSAVAVV